MARKRLAPVHPGEILVEEFLKPLALTQYRLAKSLKVPARVWREMFTDFRTADFSNEIGGITAPTLIMWGDRDSFMTREDQLALNAAIRDSRLLIYPGGGHAIHWEDPKRFTTDLLAFAAEALAHSEQRLRGGNRAIAP